MFVLADDDYIIVLQYYGIHTINLTPNELREKATHMLATKLCKCTNNLTNSKNNLKYKHNISGEVKLTLKH